MKWEERSFGSGRQMAFRGSKRRLRRIRLRDHLGWGFVWLILWVLFIFVVVIPWMLSHPHSD
jgi:hypothetical protein